MLPKQPKKKTAPGFKPKGGLPVLVESFKGATDDAPIFERLRQK